MTKSRLPDSTNSWRAFQATKLYDALTAAPVILVFGSSGAHLAKGLLETLLQTELSSVDAVFAISLLRQAMGLVLILLLMTFLIVRNPAKVKARGVMPRLAAFAGTYLGVLIVWLPPQPIPVVLSSTSLLLMVAGVGFSIYSISHLGRSFSLMAEARNLVMDGPYAKIRHPLYLGEAMSFLGLTLQFLSPLAVALFVVQIGFQLVRMQNEETVLGDLFPEYEQYKANTARLVPGLY